MVVQAKPEVVISACSVMRGKNGVSCPS